MNILAAIYSHSDYYPPTVNALNHLANHADSITVVCRNVKETSEAYHYSIHIKPSGKFKTIRETEQTSYFWKLKSFFLFTWTLYREIKKTQPTWFVAYDPIPLLAFSMATLWFKKKPKLWYHNHDIFEKSRLKKFSISWFAYWHEQRYFNKIDLFTLPSMERQAFFPLHNFSGTFIFLPNYPTLTKFKSHESQPLHSKLRILYQGHIGSGHGLLEILDFVKNYALEGEIELSLIGPGDRNYIERLKKSIVQHHIEHLVRIYPPVSHEMLVEFTAKHHIGLAIHKPINIAFQTAATSSNKIYEYIACGLPVILFDSEAYRKPMENKNWAFFTNLETSSLTSILNHVKHHYDSLSAEARKDFETHLNFELYFSNVISFINSSF